MQNGLRLADSVAPAGDAAGGRAPAKSPPDSARRLRGGARREAQMRVKGLLDGLADDTLGPHDLVQCEAYDGADALTSDPQPFALKCHPDAAFLCDLHAHLCEAEIIGLLGGRWDAARKIVHVQAPFPCAAVAREDDGATDVEMDPVSEFQVREVIRAHDLDVVGWYSCRVDIPQTSRGDAAAGT